MTLGKADNSMEPAEWADVQASVSGDGEAYARIVRRHQGEIAAYMYRFSRDRQTCEELVQDVFVQVYQSLHGFRGQSPLSHWMRRIATRVGYRYWRIRRRESEQAAQSIHDLGDITAARSRETDLGVLELMDRLPPRDRLVLTLMYLENCSIADIAELTGWSQTLVKVQAWRARGKLRRLLERTEKRL